jgi:myo-inositol-1(or 4)-monophosphatase
MNVTKAMEIALDASKSGGDMLKKKLGQRRSVTLKGHRDLVTDADIASQQRIVSVIRKSFPDHEIIAEESAGIQALKKENYQWIVDPLDGTTNFSHGLPEFAVSIGLAFKNEIILGTVYNPVLDEMYCAERNKGAFLNGQKIYVSEVKGLEQSLIATGFPYDIKTDSNYNFDHFINFEKRVQALRRLGAAALNLAYVACGRFDAYWESKLEQWDMAAGILLVQEAGGKISDFKGNPFQLEKGQVVASNKAIHLKVLEVLASGRSGMDV